MKENNCKNKIPERLKLLRAERRMTQSTLANILGVPRSTVANWESGLRRPPTSMCIKLCKFFDVTADFLYGTSIGRNIVTAPPTFRMNVNLLNNAGKQELLLYYDYLLTKDGFRNEVLCPPENPNKFNMYNTQKHNPDE